MNSSNRLASGYRKLIVWQEAKRLAVLIYKLTSKFPRSEEFALSSQMRRAVISIISQIAEGWLRRSIKDKLHYLEIAEGSLLELESQGEVAKKVGYLLEDDFKEFDKKRAVTAYLLYRYKIRIGQEI